MRSIPATGSPPTSATSRSRTPRSCASEGLARSIAAPGVPAHTSPQPRNRAERRAAWWYRLRGYRILDTNCWLARAEIDVVARRGRVVVFCEVKSKSGMAFGDPLEMVDERKQARVRRAAGAWL